MAWFGQSPRSRRSVDQFRAAGAISSSGCAGATGAMDALDGDVVVLR
jgi:hypothetical protein